MGLLYLLLLFSQSSCSIVLIPVLGVILREREADHSHLVPKLRTHGGVTPLIYFLGVVLNKAQGPIYISVPSTLICSSRFTVVKRMYEHHNQIRSRGRFKAFRLCAGVWISTMREGPLRALFVIFFCQMFIFCVRSYIVYILC